MTKLICPKILLKNQGKDHFADLYDIKMNLKDIYIFLPSLGQEG